MLLLQIPPSQLEDTPAKLLEIEFHWQGKVLLYPYIRRKCIYGGELVIAPTQHCVLVKYVHMHKHKS